jgi:tripartite-type tricarboxylate transporter receptor subunit TctC
MVRALVLALAAAWLATPALSQTYPSRPIRFIVPFPPGGAFDLLARTTGQKISESVGQPVVVENRAGASGQVGNEVAARAPADGYTIVIVSTPFTIGQASGRKIPYDALKDFTPLSLLVLQPNVLLVSPAVAARSVGELVALAKEQPGKLTYAVGSVGSAPHLAGELLKAMAGIDTVRVFYNGAAPAQRALLAGEVTMLFDSPATWTGQIQSGKIRALGVTTKARSPALPDVPAISETPGLESYFVDSFFGVVAPAGTPKPVADRLSDEFARALKVPEVHERLTKQGFTVVGSSGEEFGAFLRSQVENWKKAIELSGVKLD